MKHFNNPYNYNLPTDENMFYGRHELVNKIVQTVLSNLGDSIALIGGRRIGKTSLLEAVYRSLSAPVGSDRLKPIPILIDLKGEVIESPQDFLRVMLNCIDEEIACSEYNALDPLSSQLSSTYSGGAFHRKLDGWATGFLKRYGLQPRLVILFDECEKLSGAPWSASLQGMIRAMLTAKECRSVLKIVLAGSHGFWSRAKSPGSPLSNILSYHYLSVLDRDSAIKLIKEPIYHLFEDNDFIIPTNIVDLLLEYTGGHPFLLQYLMYMACEESVSGITAEQIQHAVQSFYMLRPDFSDWQTAIGKIGTRVYHALAKSNTPLDQISVRNAIGVHSELVSLVLTELYCYGIITNTSSVTHYQIAGRMFNEWLMNSHDFSRPLTTIRPRQTQDLSDHIMNCPCMEDRGIRDGIVKDLPDDVRYVIPRNPQTNVDVYNIVREVVERGYLEQLIDFVRFYERDSLPFQKLEQYLKSLT